MIGAKNVGKGEQALRILLGIISAAMAIWMSEGGSRWLLAFIGVFLVATALVGY